jgi:deazaflavin-dependent oxidoreductase (nitroreductase family)
MTIAPDVQTALDTDRIIDITTTGRKSGTPQRIEIWFHRVDGKLFITGKPPRPRSWYANLIADPHFTFHVKQSATADLAATARSITDRAERERVFAGIFGQIPELTTDPATPAEVWVDQAPLVEVALAD